ncbi:MAG TPA: carboxypeptidase-like regulatory domain-containing protein [Phycisphaerales bacterium]|nr:carboxypeptidase-like regulatory domain-containing protein [Phycisphaerales bacterium]
MFFSKPLLYLLLLCSCFVTLGLQATPPASDVTPKSVTFVVRRTTGEPLPRASIVVEVTARRWVGGGVTDADGRLTVRDVPCTTNQDVSCSIRIKHGWGPGDEPSADVVSLYARTAIRSPLTRTLAAADEHPLVEIAFEPGRRVKGSVSFSNGVEPTESLSAVVAGMPEWPMRAAPTFSVAYVRHEATTLFYGASKLLSLPIPAGTEDFDTGALIYLPEISNAQVTGEVDVDPVLFSRYGFGMEASVSFIRLSDHAVFRRPNHTASTGAGADRRRVWPLGDSADTSSELSLPAGEYLVVPGRFLGHDFQVRAFEKVVAGEPLPPPCKVFTAVADQRTDIGRIDYKAMIDYFLTPSQPPPAP